MNKEKIVTAIRETWDKIACDVINMEIEMGGDFVSQGVAIEMTLDANRMSDYGGLDSEDLEAFNEMPFLEKMKIAKEALPEPRWEI